MSLVYEICDNNRKVLVEIKCDSCGVVIKPHPQISESGWVYRGWRENDSTKYELHHCPKCK